MRTSLDGAGVATHDHDYHLALQWAAASVDALIMNQLGRGIFAGLHWFPNYWGSDTFIALPGACLVRGEFDTAREILESFAALQETDEDSLLFGRIPNLAMPGEIYYNTADGTWWFVREAYEYVRYTGDLEFAERFMPVIARAHRRSAVAQGGRRRVPAARAGRDVDGRRRRDEPVLAARQPCGRGAGPVAHGAALRGGDRGCTRRERGGLEVARGRGTARDFLPARIPRPRDSGPVTITSTPTENPTGRYRPNQVFAATVPWDDLLPREQERAMLELVRETCVLRHGVTTLHTEDPDFHPTHLDLERYHFDEAYHNGDVWVWLTGPVVSALVKHGLVAAAWEQTSVLADMMFDEGAAGTLSELRNGVPPECGENVAGAVSQAWSLSEFLRNFYQDYLGVRPNVLDGTVDVRPALPPSCSWMAAPVRVGRGSLFVLHRVDSESGRACTSIVADAGAPALTVRFTPSTHPDSDVQGEGETFEAVLEPGGSVRFDSAK